MIRNYFKTAFRNLRKNKLYSAINIFGLTIGITACLLIGLYISQELSYDAFNSNSSRIVRTTMEYGKAGTINSTATTGTKVGPQFKRLFPEIKEYVRTFISHNVVTGNNKMFDEPRILYADEAFFKLFSFHLIEGEPATVLDAPDKIVITQSMAKKYFGNQETLNKTLTSGGKDLRISGICEDIPQNSQLKFDFVTNFMNLGNGVKDETWWTANWITYFLLDDKKSIAILQEQVNNYMSSPAVKKDAGLEGNSYLTYHFEPLARVHLFSSLAGFEPNGSIRYVYMFAIIALLILIIACANYTNLATAQSTGRSGEIGMRKVMGASPAQVFMQFIGESSVITFVSAALAFIFGILLIPYFNNITGFRFTSAMLMKPVPIIFLLLFSILVSLCSGLYPAVVLSRTQALGVLKNGFSFTGGNKLLQKILIVAQFSISVFLIIYTVIILQQMQFMQTKNLGYNKEQVLVLPIGGKMLQEFQHLKDAFSQEPTVEGVTASYDTPEYVQWSDGITVMDEKGKHEISLNAMPVDLDFIKTMKMELAAGRDFQQSDWSMMDTANNSSHFRQPYLINESLAAKIGWSPQQSIGKMIENRFPGPVLGVVKDFNFSSLHNPIGPLLLFLGRDFSRNFMIRINGNDMPKTVSHLEEIWKQRVPDRPFNYHFLDDDYNKLYQAEHRTSAFFCVSAGLAIVLACLGLFGLVAFTTVQRTKEIGIRRVLGASISNITLLVAKNFLLLVSVAILIAVPIAWWAGSKWLQDFSYRIPVHKSIFVLTSLVTVVLAFLTLGYHSIRVALLNPAKSMRTE